MKETTKRRNVIKVGDSTKFMEFQRLSGMAQRNSLNPAVSSAFNDSTASENH